MVFTRFQAGSGRSFLSGAAEHGEELKILNIFSTVDICSLIIYFVG